MDVNELKREVDKVKWWHKIDLGNGIVTPGVDRSRTKLNSLKMPADLRGLTVLDIGAADGFFSFEAERRGATRTLAIDSFFWSGDGLWTKDGFNLARRTLNSQVEDLELDVLDMSPEKIGTFDLVLFLGVLYHMRHPLLALEKVYSVTAGQLILESHVDMVWSKRPLMVFYPGNECNNDPTNWWGPSPGAVIEMLRAVGFRHVEIVSKVSLTRTIASALKTQITAPHKGRLVAAQGQVRRPRFVDRLRQRRMVFHAWR